MTGTGPDRRLDAVLHLLDRQLVDRNGRLVAKVDDLELTDTEDGRLAVTAVLVGPGALGPRLGGRLGAWVRSAWARLHPLEHPAPVRIPFADVTEIGSALTLSRARAELGADSLEAWVTRHVVSRIPGAGHAPE